MKLAFVLFYVIPACCNGVSRCPDHRKAALSLDVSSLPIPIEVAKLGHPIVLTGGTAGPAEPTHTTERKSLKLTLLDLDKQDYRLGDETTIRLCLENVGPTSIRLPWTRNYRLVGAITGSNRLDVGIGLTLLYDGTHRITLPSVALYGDRTDPKTFRLIGPGDVAEIITPLKLSEADLNEPYAKGAREVKFEISGWYHFFTGADSWTYRDNHSDRSVSITIRAR